jgi:hypothetical protein
MQPLKTLRLTKITFFSKATKSSSYRSYGPTFRTFINLFHIVGSLQHVEFFEDTTYDELLPWPTRWVSEDLRGYFGENSTSQSIGSRYVPLAKLMRGVDFDAATKTTTFSIPEIWDVDTVDGGEPRRNVKITMAPLSDASVLRGL